MTFRRKVLVFSDLESLIRFHSRLCASASADFIFGRFGAEPRAVGNFGPGDPEYETRCDKVFVSDPVGTVSI